MDASNCEVECDCGGTTLQWGVVLQYSAARVHAPAAGVHNVQLKLHWAHEVIDTNESRLVKNHLCRDPRVRAAENSRVRELPRRVGVTNSCSSSICDVEVTNCGCVVHRVCKLKQSQGRRGQSGRTSESKHGVRKRSSPGVRRCQSRILHCLHFSVYFTPGSRAFFDGVRTFSRKGRKHRRQALHITQQIVVCAPFPPL